MTDVSEPRERDYRAFTLTGEVTAFLHRHNRPLIVAGGMALAVLMLANG